MQNSCQLTDLPVVVCELILSYLPDTDVLKVAETCENFRYIVEHKRHFDFSKNLYMKEDDLIKVWKTSRNIITHLNLNHCYWLRSKSLNFNIDFPKLKELHLIDCNITNAVHRKRLPVGLESLSFTWNNDLFDYEDGFDHDKSDTYYSEYENVHYESYSMALFGSLKELRIDFYPTKDERFFRFLFERVLKHCYQLQTLRLTEAVYSRTLEVREYFVYRDKLFKVDVSLPNLSKLYIDLGFCSEFERPFVNNWLTILLRKNNNLLLKDIDLGMWSCYFGQCRDDLENVSMEDITVACLDGFCRSREQQTADVSKLWRSRHKKTEKCKKVSLNFTRCEDIDTTTELIAEMCPSLKEFSLRGCTIANDGIGRCLTTLANKIPNLVVLDLTLHQTSGYETNFFELLAEFKELRILRVSSFYASKAGDSDGNSRETTNVSKESMMKSALWITTQNCKKIEEFEISDVKQDVSRYQLIISENFLACISKWKNLKTLNLRGVLTHGRGAFLPYITKSCCKLETLNLSQVCHSGECNYMPSLIECLLYAINLKHLSIVQDMTFSLNLCKSLLNCNSLQRIYFHAIEIEASDRSHLTNLLTRLPNLVAVFFITRNTTTATINSIKRTLKRFRNGMESFVHLVVDRGNVDFSKIPAVHLDFLLRSTERVMYLNIYKDYE
ncbi:hypothetical protein CHUAL_005506 [Chamberlinius hualienensis]